MRTDDFATKKESGAFWLTSTSPFVTVSTWSQVYSRMSSVQASMSTSSELVMLSETVENRDFGQQDMAMYQACLGARTTADMKFSLYSRDERWRHSACRRGAGRE